MKPEDYENEIAVLHLRERLRNAEVARLTSELAATKENRDFWYEATQKAWESRDFASTLRQQAEAELAAARENEARYLWLRDQGHVGPHPMPYARIAFGYTAEELDAIVDATRRAGEGEA